MGFSRKRQSILVGLAKVCTALAPNMQFYFYRIDRKVMGAKWSRALDLLLCKEEWGLLEGLVLVQRYLMQSKHKQSINEMQQTWIK
jgi:hypothetical protein